MKQWKYCFRLNERNSIKFGHTKTKFITKANQTERKWSVFRLAVLKAKPKYSQRPIRKYLLVAMRTQSKTKLPKARENADDQVVISLSFAFDWLKEWREFSGPTTERSKTKQSNPRLLN